MTKGQALTTGVEDEGSAQSQPVTEHACEHAATAGAEPSGFAGLTRRQQIDIERHIRGLSEGPDTYNAPRHGWTCFHCGETFLTEAGARLHFGEKVTGRPTCDLAAVEASISAHVKVRWQRDPGGGGGYELCPKTVRAAALVIVAAPLTAKDTSDGKEIPGNPKLNNAETPPTSPSDSAEGE